MENNVKEGILEEIMKEHGSDLVRLAFNYLKDQETAKDVVQNTFIICYEKLDSFRFESSIKTWLYRITINQCKDYLRSWHYRKVHAKSFIGNVVSSISSTTEDVVIKESANEELKKFVFSLPDKYREVIYLYYYKSFTIGEIAEVTELNVNTVKTRMKRAKHKLKIIIEEANAYG
ncbi:sigma-70 family RNA polymerase sigma factor [Ornithinibacillus salinisoli]|uniref:Sigma-70 family RNA polymerase sigma factor n=1 Tax=Ornithinibacillus salinisoli TaxID=1848459 RepID=A0ABW4W348_9BACI